MNIGDVRYQKTDGAPPRLASKIASRRRSGVFAVAYDKMCGRTHVVDWNVMAHSGWCLLMPVPLPQTHTHTQVLASLTLASDFSKGFPAPGGRTSP